MRFRNLAVPAALAWLLACVATANSEPSSRGAIAVLGSDSITAWEPLDTARLLTPVIVRGDTEAKPMRAERPQSFGEELAQSCCKVCRKGKACGNSCISRSKTCTKPPGCACDAH